MLGKARITALKIRRKKIKMKASKKTKNPIVNRLLYSFLCKIQY